MTITKYFCLLGAIFLALTFLPVAANADTGIPSGTTISNIARVTWKVSGTDSYGITPSTDTTVRSVASDTLSDPGDQGLAPGDTKYFTYSFVNTGNRADTFRIWIADSTAAAGAVDWRVTLFVDNVRTDLVNDTKTTVATVAADGTGSCSVAVYASSILANSPDGANWTFTLGIAPGNQSNADTWTQYTGDNGITYAAGSAGSNDTSKATIAAPIITLAKAITSVTIGAQNTHPLPGATILYTLTYANTGSGSADSVAIIDTIPANTTFDTASYLVGDVPLGSDATYHLTDSTLGLVCQVTTVAAPNQTFGGGADWTNLNAFAYANRANVRYVRWVKTSVAPIGNTTIRFRVIIQ